jgi:hypothetical protein
MFCVPPQILPGQEMPWRLPGACIGRSRSFGRLELRSPSAVKASGGHGIRMSTALDKQLCNLIATDRAQERRAFNSVCVAIRHFNLARALAEWARSAIAAVVDIKTSAIL